MKINALLVALASLACAGVLSGQKAHTATLLATQAASANDDARSILARFAHAWRGKEEMRLPDTMVVGLRITGTGGGEYHIVVPPDGPAVLGEGIPRKWDIVFETSIDVLRKLDRGEMNALTAMGQARSTDPVPLVPHFPEGFQWTPEARALYPPFAFHFWNREWPEVIRFGESATRPIHGANAAVLYYDSGLRTAWYQVKAGMHINEDPADQIMQTRLAGIERELREGETVLVPAGMTHEFWAAEGQYAEFVIVMFGTDA